MSGSTARYILPSQQAATKFLVRAAIAWLFKILQIWGVGEREQGPPYRNLISKYWLRYSHVIYNKFVIGGVRAIYLNLENLRLIRANSNKKPNTTYYQTTPPPLPKVGMEWIEKSQDFPQNNQSNSIQQLASIIATDMMDSLSSMM